MTLFGIYINAQIQLTFPLLSLFLQLKRKQGFEFLYGQFFKHPSSNHHHHQFSSCQSNSNTLINKKLYHLDVLMFTKVNGTNGLTK